MSGRIIERGDGAAVNCLTGSYANLTRLLGRPVPEQTVFERGEGYLFQGGLDEAGYPEYIFPVEETGALGMTRLGFTVHRIPIDFDAIAAQLATLLDQFPGVVVWVNTAHLTYADAYRKSDRYLHAVLIDQVAADRGTAGVLDSLVVDLTPFSCRAELDIEDLARAAGDRIRSEAHDGMGFFYAASDDAMAPSPGAMHLGDALSRQAARFFAEDRFSGAIRRYQQLCAECFAGPPERAAHGARRLFHHASVLYAVPSLKLMGRSLCAAQANPETMAAHQTVLRHWEAMGVLALRFEATALPSVLDRITRRFADLDEATTRLWASLLG